MKKTFKFVLFSLGLTLSFQAEACRCIIPKWNLKKCAAAFEGEALPENQFRVTKKLKNTVADTVTVEPSPDNCRMDFKVGSSYRVCLNKKMSTTKCLPNMLLD